MGAGFGTSGASHPAVAAILFKDESSGVAADRVVKVNGGSALRLD